MNFKKKTLLISIFAMLILGVVLVSASSYYSASQFHKRMMGADNFEEMYTAMMSGDFVAAEQYHQNLDFECPMHDLVKEGDVSLEDFQTMHEWMTTGDFPQEKPEGLSDAAWKIHMSHHPEVYN